MNMDKHKPLFFIRENCHSPVIIPERVEVSVLQHSDAIICKICTHEHRDLEELKSYAKQSRNYSKH